MKLKKTKTLTKTIRTFEVHPELTGVTLVVSHENEKLTGVSLDGKGPHGSYPMFMKPGFREIIQKYSPWAQINYKYVMDEYRIDPKELIKDDYVIDPQNFVYVYSSGHVLFDVNGDPIPTPYCFDYIGTPFTNEHCDLEKMLAHLKQHPWVTNADDLYIDEVPYYNNEEGWRQYIRGKELPWVSILPDAASLKEIYQRALEIDEELFSARMKDIILGDAVYNWKTTKEKDYLGIRQFHSPHRKSDW
jgi:hypothetical protein